MLDKIADLPVALADQGDHADIGGTVARHAAQQRALTYAAAPEDPDPLAFAAGQQAIDGADSGCERFTNRLPVKRARRGSIEIVGFLGANRSQAIQRLAESVNDAAQQFRPHLHPGVVFAAGNRIAQVQSIRFFERHRQHAALAKSNHLRANQASVPRGNLAEVADTDHRTV